eukprot:SAG31_NODE_1702_length_7496_cov_2.367311_8_plen_155_part_00
MSTRQQPDQAQRTAHRQAAELLPPLLPWQSHHDGRRRRRRRHGCRAGARGAPLAPMLQLFPLQQQLPFLQHTAPYNQAAALPDRRLRRKWCRSWLPPVPRGLPRWFSDKPTLGRPSQDRQHPPEAAQPVQLGRRQQRHDQADRVDGREHLPHGR